MTSSHSQTERYIPKTLPTMQLGSWAIWDNLANQWLIYPGYPAIRTADYLTINNRCKELNTPSC